MQRQPSFHRKLDASGSENPTQDMKMDNQSEQDVTNSHSLSSHNFTVAVRIKPKEPHEQNVKIILNKNCKEMSIETTKQMRNNYIGGKCKTFKMDAIFEEKVTNNTIFTKTVKEKLSLLKSNRNIALMAYGATNSGKTYTILGSNKNAYTQQEGLVHITYRYLMQDLFQGSFKFYFSYLQIYNQNVQDLLCEQQRRHNLNVFEDHSGKINIPQLTRIEVSSYDDICQLIQQGSIARAESSNNINKLSSRSHAILQLEIFSVQDGDHEVTQAPIDANFMVIDLAGSEKSTPYFQESQQITLKEGSNINRSLLALGNCIKNLANGEAHIPYRNSKLTRLLKQNLSGSCHNIMIACISHNSMQFEQSINTLQYASKACRIEIAKNMVQGRDRGKFVTIPCEHCKMSIDFGYLSKSMKQRAFQVVDLLGDTCPKVFKQKIPSIQQSLLDNVLNRIRKISAQPQKLDYLSKLIENIEHSDPKVQINIQETDDSQRQNQQNSVPHQKSFLKLKTKLNLNIDRGSLKLAMKATTADEKSKQRPNRSRSQKSTKLRLKQRQSKTRPSQTIEKQPIASYIKIEQPPKSLNISSINSRKDDSKILSMHHEDIHPFLPELSFDISDYYHPREKMNNNRLQKEFEGIHFLRQKRNSQPLGSLNNKENSQLFGNLAEHGSKTQRDTSQEKSQLISNRPSADSKIIRRMKQDIICSSKESSRDTLSKEVSIRLTQGELKNKIKLIARVR